MILRLGLITLIGLLPYWAKADEKKPNYGGRYELAGHFPGRVFKLSLIQYGNRVHAVFYAADSNEPNAKPTGEGDGRIDDKGVLELKFKDSVANKGTAILEPAKNLYRFEMRMTNIVNTEPLHFYGVLTMKKVGEPTPAAISSM